MHGDRTGMPMTTGKHSRNSAAALPSEVQWMPRTRGRALGRSGRPGQTSILTGGLGECFVGASRATVLARASAASARLSASASTEILAFLGFCNHVFRAIAAPSRDNSRPEILYATETAYGRRLRKKWPLQHGSDWTVCWSTPHKTLEIRT